MTNQLAPRPSRDDEDSLGQSNPDSQAQPGPLEVNPWTTLERRSIYENPWIEVVEDRVLRPDGAPGIYGVVRFKNQAVGVLPVEEDGSIWLVGQWRYTFDHPSWEIPEGGGPEGEDPRETARRELAEETGLTATRIEPMPGLGTLHLSNSVTNEVGWIFRATGLTPGPSAPEGTERLVARRVGFEEAMAMLGRGEITDALSVCALLAEALWRQTQPHAQPTE
ncbi:NUDIX hydrolase [Isosphaera pallida ATCC 43644]|jgi:8-oxo-dGTP pyrophosphatase MutT (NUDIX family)|uniref:GDP-mannose pyrophosphatase n=1 Tax=Isosphaera pallida (strain ATCC 43644 / DSM 9630 / IS1B) TaxID=575540 RepID=E8R0D9_ISOPI|nr:NUDIX hydrolase [Isosphaera pallida]ADV62266.1 NUDIX hydrolase [Isosphaera pallida ATCC 43644]